MSAPLPELTERPTEGITVGSLSMEETAFAPGDVDYELWAASKAAIPPKEQLARYRNALNEAYAARFELEKKYSDLQSQCRCLQLEMEKKSTDHLSRLDEETFRNDILRLQLDLTQTEAAEHRDTIRIMTEKLREASQQEAALACVVEKAESKLTQKDAEMAMFASTMAQKDLIISQFEQTCDLLKTKLRKNHEYKRQEIIGLRATISSQFEVILGLSRDLEAQQQVNADRIQQLERENAAALLGRDDAVLEIQRLKDAYKEDQVRIDKLREENQSLKGDMEALVDMSIESEAIGEGYAEENRRLADQATSLNRELDLIRGLLLDQLSGLRPDLSNLSAVLNDLAGNKKATRRRPRKSPKERV